MSEAEQLENLRREFARLQTAYSTTQARLGLVRRLFSILNTTFEEEEILHQALSAAEEAIGVEAGSVLMLDREDGKLYFAAATGPKAEEIKEFRIDPGIGVAGWCLQQNEAVAVSDVPSAERFYKQISKALGFDTRSIICAPIRLAGEPAGVVELINKRVGDDFHADDLETVTLVGILAGLLIDNARRLNALSQES